MLCLLLGADVRWRKTGDWPLIPLLALHNLASAGAAVVQRYTADYWLLLKADVRWPVGGPPWPLGRWPLVASSVFSINETPQFWLIFSRSIELKFSDKTTNFFCLPSPRSPAVTMWHCHCWWITFSVISVILGFWLRIIVCVMIGR